MQRDWRCENSLPKDFAGAGDFDGRDFDNFPWGRQIDKKAA
jgi:hypothetical protein